MRTGKPSAPDETRETKKRTSPSMISVSSRMRTPMLRRNICVSASVLLISNENTSDAASDVNGVSAPSSCAMAMASAVLPVPGAPAIKIARPAIRPSRTCRAMISDEALAQPSEK